MRKWQFELFRTLFPQTTDRFCGSLPYHLQFSKPFLKYKYWHWFCYLNTSFTQVAVRSDFSLLLLITTFPFSCPFGIVQHGELLLSFLCSPTRAVWCYSLPDDLVWKRVMFEWPIQMWTHDSVRSLWRTTLHFVFAQLMWRPFLANATWQPSASQHLLPRSCDVWLGGRWAKGPRVY